MNTVVEKKRAGSVISVARVAVLAADGSAVNKLQIKLLGPAKDGEHIPVIDQIDFEPARCSAECNERAMWHGWEQRLRDAAAKPRDEKTGKSATPESKFGAIRKLAEHYLSGAKEWNLRSGPRGEGAAVSDDKQMLKAALAEYLPLVGKERTAQQIHESVEGMDKGKISALLAKKEIAEIVLKLREARATESEIDAEELLSDM